MPHPVVRAGADLRLLRAAVFTAVCVLLSAGGHALASCASVPLWTLGAGFLAVFAVAAPLAGRERSLPGIAACLAVGQLGLHALFGLGQQGPGGPGAAAAPPRAGADSPLIAFAGRLLCNQRPPMSAADARRVIADAGLDPAGHPAGMAMPMEGTPGSLSHFLPLSPPMLLGHLLAALAVGWLLRRGEVALWRAVGLSAQSARGVVAAALAGALRTALAWVRAFIGSPAEGPVRAVWCAPGHRERPAREPELQHSVIRRGPPRFDLAA